MHGEKTMHLTWHNGAISRVDRERLKGHRGFTVWFTGLSGAGKSTLAHAVEERLHQWGCRTFVFDGDNVRHGLCQDLGFSTKDRRENIRRIGEMAKLFMEAGVIVLTAFISPYRADRDAVRANLTSPGLASSCRPRRRYDPRRHPRADQGRTWRHRSGDRLRDHRSGP